jgi:hypothetical protein
MLTDRTTTFAELANFILDLRNQKRLDQVDADALQDAVRRIFYGGAPRDVAVKVSR